MKERVMEERQNDGGMMEERQNDGGMMEERQNDGGMMEERQNDGGVMEERQNEGGMMEERQNDGGVMEERQNDGGMMEERQNDGGVMEERLKCREAFPSTGGAGGSVAAGYRLPDDRPAWRRVLVTEQTDEASEEQDSGLDRCSQSGAGSESTGVLEQLKLCALTME
ncbi:unnamed protein product [Arctogadus glacialis]